MLDVLIEKARAARAVHFTEPLGTVEAWLYDVPLSPQVVIALCEVAKAAEAYLDLLGARHSGSRQRKKVRTALAHLADVMGEK